QESSLARILDVDRPQVNGAARSAVLAVLVAAGLGAFLDLRPSPPWVLWLTALLTALAVDGIVRSNPRWVDGGPQSSAVYLFLPALAVVGAGFFIDHALDGYARPASALVPAAASGAIAVRGRPGRLCGGRRSARLPTASTRRSTSARDSTGRCASVSRWRRI